MMLDFIQNYILKLQNLKVLIINLLYEGEKLPNIFAETTRILNFEESNIVEILGQSIED
jgi:hypothetical protein